jgi:Cu/Ag efflux protein CusF
MNKIFLAIIFIFLFALGAETGIIYQKFTDAPNMQKAGAADALSSGVIQSITAYGSVTSVDIESKTITLASDGDSLAIKISDSAKIYFFDSSNKIASQEVGLNDLKLGDYVDITVEITTTGELEGSNVAILI